MEPKEALFLALIRHIKDMYIVSVLYPPEEGSDQIADLLEEAATKIVLWEKDQKSKKGGDRA